VDAVAKTILRQADLGCASTGPEESDSNGLAKVWSGRRFSGIASERRSVSTVRRHSEAITPTPARPRKPGICQTRKTPPKRGFPGAGLPTRSGPGLCGLGNGALCRSLRELVAGFLQKVQAGSANSAMRRSVSAETSMPRALASLPALPRETPGTWTR
jgi:hypothetical protein